MKGVLYSAALRAMDGDQTALAVLSDVQHGHPVKQIAAVLLACLQGQLVPAVLVLEEPHVAALCLSWVCASDTREKRRILRALCDAAEQAQRPIGVTL